MNTNLPYDPNESIVVTTDRGEKTIYPRNLIPGSEDLDVTQLYYDVARIYSGAPPPKTAAEKLRLKVFRTPTCQLVSPTATARFTPYTKDIPTIFLTTDSIMYLGTDISPSKKAIKFESDHTVRNNGGTDVTKDYFQQKTVKIPNAVKLKITWDKKSYIDKNNDTFTLCASTEADESKILYQWSPNTDKTLS